MPHPQSTTARLSSIIRRCAGASALRPGEQAHSRVIVLGLVPHSTLETDLLLLYARCSRFPLARLVFDRMTHRPLHAWNIILSAYTQGSLFHPALSCLHSLLDSGLRPDHFTLPSLLKASAGLGLRPTGAALHAWAVRLALVPHLFVSASLIDMYLKCGYLLDARELFDEIPERDRVVWNAMITGLVRAGLFGEALGLFRMSQWESFDMDWMSVPSVLSACSSSGDLRRGKEVHGRAIRCLVCHSDVAIGNSLIEMYSKCGFLDASFEVFARMSYRNLATWSGCDIIVWHPWLWKEALMLFEEMRTTGLEPNSIVFTSVLLSCSHAGLVNDGRAVFESITLVYGLVPSIEHYACMVDLLGRNGSIEEALELIQTMRTEPTASIWGALLAASSVQGNVEVGELAATKLFAMEPRNSSNYVALCRIYERARNWDAVAEMRRKMRELGGAKLPGCSWLEVKGKTLCFYQAEASLSKPVSSKMLQVLSGLLNQSQLESFDKG
ncbi:hypothetical protein HPP92_026902 [Vanilla planifolia]|uniref:Pentatricopeptide repeat-containing protein n=2 Tax=Vanilla planifolia TaxID=51239 RepID=A0A835PES1_VANPL|nr:hypothetical protein HPP92_026902 [Vanilla planifolia]